MHPVVLRGLGMSASGDARPNPANAPGFLKRTETDFVRRFLELVVSPAGRVELAGAAQPEQGDPKIKLLQPVHRVFYLTCFEVVCDLFGDPTFDGAPRLDPSQIESAGFVVRRVVGDEPNPTHHAAWLRSRDKSFHWEQLDGAEDLDPDPARWAAPAPSANAAAVRRIGGSFPDPSDVGVEVSTQLFTAPPAVSAGLGRTVLFGVVPVASSDLADRPFGLDGQPQSALYSDADVIQPSMLPAYFQASVSVSLDGIADQTFAYFAGPGVDQDWKSYADGSKGTPPALDKFVTMLKQLVVELNLLGDDTLKKALDSVTFTYADGSTRSGGDALREAALLFVRGDETVTVKMPSQWPPLSPAQAAVVRKAALGAANTRLGRMLPRQGRFDTPGARYRIRGFVRVKRDDGCPPRIVWSPYSAPFTIAAWYETSDLPPVQIALPAVTKDNVKNFLPNVTFNVPKGIFNLLNANKPDDFLKGKAADGGSLGLDWICGFNIPIITLCAFIVLNIFLSLLNIVFWWLPFIKICIPVPSSLKGKLPNGLTS